MNTTKRYSSCAGSRSPATVCFARNGTTDWGRFLPVIACERGRSVAIPHSLNVDNRESVLALSNRHDTLS